MKILTKKSDFDEKLLNFKESAKNQFCAWVIGFCCGLGLLNIAVYVQWILS